MTEIEKIDAQLLAVQEALAATQHAVIVERKMGGSKHTNGHFTKALTELNHEMAHLQSLRSRAERQSV